MKIENSKIVVLGGAGDVGEGISAALLRRGAHVIAHARSEEKLGRLRSYVSDIGVGELSTVAGVLDGLNEAEALRNEVHDRFGDVDAVVAVLGGWTQGYPVTGVPFDQWTEIVQNNLTSHFLAMKAFVPLLKPRGAYIHINGTSAEGAYPGAGPIAAMAAAQKSLVLTLAEELRRANLRANEIILPPVNTRKRVSLGHGLPHWPSALEVGEFVATIIENDEAPVLNYLDKGRAA